MVVETTTDDHADKAVFEYALLYGSWLLEHISPSCTSGKRPLDVCYSSFIHHNHTLTFEVWNQFVFTSVIYAVGIDILFKVIHSE